jgi:outer membrane lipoprotein-sorting protein
MRTAAAMFCLLIGCLPGLTLAAQEVFTPIPAHATIDQVLDALKIRGDTLGSFTADVKLTEVDQATADSSANVGRVWFQKRPNGDSRIRVQFTQRIEGDKTFAEKHEYTLADGWLTECDYQKKTEVQRQVVKSGEKINLLKLGEGPFPLPIGQDKQDVHRDFDVSMIPAAEDDPAGTVHLTLKPKPKTDLATRFSQIDVWVDRQSGMPVQIVTLDSSGERTQTTQLSDIHLNATLSDLDFALPQTQGWDVTQEPYGQ